MVRQSEFQALLRKVNNLEREIRSLYKFSNKSKSKDPIKSSGDIIEIGKQVVSALAEFEAYKVYMLTYSEEGIGNTVCSITTYDSTSFADDSKQICIALTHKKSLDNATAPAKSRVQLGGIQYARIDQSASENQITVNSPLKVKDSTGVLQYDDNGTETAFYSLERPNSEDDLCLVKFVSGGVSTEVVPVMITSQIAYNKYYCYVYGNGRFDADGNPQSQTEVGQVLYIPQIASGERIPNNSFIMAVKVGDHYEGQAPVCL